MLQRLRFVLVLFIFISQVSQAQILSGKVFDGKGGSDALPGANVYWLNADNGTTTDENGKFEISRGLFPSPLIISFTGYKTDTLTIANDENKIEVFLESSTEDMDEVVVVAERKGSYFDKLSSIDTETISAEGVQRLACCSLAD